VSHVISGIVGLVLTDRDAAAAGFALGLQHNLRGLGPGGAIGMRDHTGHRQTMSVLHGGMAHIAELCLPPGRLAIKPAVWVAGTGMGVVLALLAMEVRAVIIVTATVLGAKALLRSPGFDERSVHRKMLVRQQRLDL